jgi:hypothetical protein
VGTDVGPVVEVVSGRLVTVTSRLMEGMMVDVSIGAVVINASGKAVAVGLTAGASGMEQANPTIKNTATNVTTGENLFIFPRCKMYYSQCNPVSL